MLGIFARSIAPATPLLRSFTSTSSVLEIHFGDATKSLQKLSEELSIPKNKRLNSAAETIAALHLAGQTDIGKCAATENTPDALMLRSLLLGMAMQHKLLCMNPALTCDARPETIKALLKIEKEKTTQKKQITPILDSLLPASLAVYTPEVAELTH